ncbi:uncharacterized protein LOC111082237 isoform X2 [Drosophila obscura]|uniref:uncharacterized protein LOC111082237 isoform X2 n=1 Tax=Drosophila obscura TaxID=7282 RepID=UPI001BB17E11|nr:uncharacterized protein LOC111082237 isoform X2 [Drosophila obscura]
MYPIFWLILATLIRFSCFQNQTDKGHFPGHLSYLDKMECGDCKMVNEECEIVSSGFYCREEEDSDQIDAQKGVVVNLRHLRECMGPDHYFFNHAQRKFRQHAVFGRQKWDASKS